MKITFINRNPTLGFSIHKVFLPIIRRIGKREETTSYDLEGKSGSLHDVIRNLKYIRSICSNESDNIVYHITGDVHYAIYALLNRKTIITVHDLGRYFDLRGVHKYLYWVLRILPLKFASKVVCISNYTVKELQAAIKIPKDKIIVIPDAVGDDYCYRPKTLNVDCPVILHLGTRPHKNLERTIKALSGIKCCLHVIGTVDEYLMSLANQCKVQMMVRNNLTDIEILEEYEIADIINFPSLHEGFGMPIIEGQAVGRCIVTSDLEPMRSVAGEGAVLCNPYNVDSIRETYLKILNNPLLAQETIEKGLQNVMKYRLDSVTDKYIELYKSL